MNKPTQRESLLSPRRLTLAGLSVAIGMAIAFVLFAFLFVPASVVSHGLGYVVSVVVLLAAAMVAVRWLLNLYVVEDDAWRLIGLLGALTYAVRLMLAPVHPVVRVLYVVVALAWTIRAVPALRAVPAARRQARSSVSRSSLSFSVTTPPAGWKRKCGKSFWNSRSTRLGPPRFFSIDKTTHSLKRWAARLS